MKILPAELYIVALAAQDRIIDLCALAVDPADHIGVRRDKTVEINRDRTNLGARVTRYVDRILCMLLFLLDETGRSLFVLLLSLVVFVEYRIETEAAESDDR